MVKHHTLTIAEWELKNYSKFQDEKMLIAGKWDMILGICKEEMDSFARAEFEWLRELTRAMIIETIIENKKKDGTFNYFNPDESS